MVKALCDFGAKPAEAANELYENESFARIQLIQLFLASLEIECGGRVCFGLLTDSMYQESGASIDDADGLVDYARSIQGVEVGVLLEERNGALKGSLRAKDSKFRVDQIAQAFGGGGHACAAGLNVESMDIEAFKPQVLAKIKEQFALLEKE
jgi:phosphoesterase RecJ-like protein